jgi:hypothetical protein
MEPASEVGDGFSEAELCYQAVQSNNVAAFYAAGEASEVAVANVHGHRRVFLMAAFMYWAIDVDPRAAAFSDA